jgi:hypothetical protein
LLELSLSDYFDLSPASFCQILANMKNLKKLNIYQANLSSAVTQTISKTCSKLENLSLDNCINLYDTCLEEISESLHQTLTHLSLGNFLIL